MTEHTNDKENKRARKDLRIVVSCLAFVGGMVGMSYAAVPLYAMFCQVTGYGGTTQRVDQASETVLDRDIKVHFDANTGSGLAWDFGPERREIKLKIGETVQANYLAVNNTDHELTGQATYNVTPQSAGAYFNKVQCFCFTETTLKPGEKLEMPVVFFVDPDIVNDEDTKDITTITLSYTFYPHEKEKPVAAAAKPVQDNKQL
ncbi:cytochrome c oxidase assembly protein [Pseudohoeflea suaedae]|uniref:Cytochrome c oxidase assembly protein CtaG n=1 Tax=Pseudohoeflea suaedae TaxID=877384 RepID=A0A4R5PP99_9HYPH|nr:cytochrome c oxidase assembly protein [Pseudohoeflea suaedae]TDH38683.1 cytochrome c oxidase assembly protein [Pseudohoeflea suaedae]